MNSRLTLLAALSGAAVAAGAAHADPIDATVLYDLPRADVVIVGEVHDNPIHHAHQAIVLGEIAPAAVVFEMLEPAQAERARPPFTETEDALGAMLMWEESGWPDFAMYYPLFVAARGSAIVGGGGDREEARRAVEAGAAEVFGSRAAEFGLDVPLDAAEQSARDAAQIAAHCDAIPASLAPGMVEAQRLKDAWLARAVVEAYETTGGPVAVITGNGHARRDWGIPRFLERAAPDLSVLSVGQYEIEAPDAPPFDYWLVTDPAPRPDPCAAFR